MSADPPQRRPLAPWHFLLTRWLYLRLLGLSSIFAFVSLTSQMDGLFLSGGILPAARFMESVRSYAEGQHWGALRRLMEVPTLAWLSASDGVLVRLLLFKLMFLSGAVKLMARNDTWTSLAALDVHFFTQPLPTWSAYYAHFAPHWLHVAALLVMFIVELVLPFFVFGSRRARALFGLGCMFLMLTIGLSGNYGFFNLLTFTLAVLCLDDPLVGRVLPAGLRKRLLVDQSAALQPKPRFRHWLTWAAASGLLSLSALQMLYRLDPETQVGRTVSDAIDPLLSVNGYGLFQDMTMSRPEVVIEGSRDGRTWETYDFEYKPGDLYRRPALAGPFMPRLDWQMWFAALSGCEGSYWFHSLLGRLFEGSSAVRALLARAPFGPHNPPLYLRTTLYDYKFAPPGTSNWWTRSTARPFCPTLRRQGEASARAGD